jgi:hypothetical protein
MGLLNAGPPDAGDRGGAAKKSLTELLRDTPNDTSDLSSTGADTQAHPCTLTRAGTADLSAIKGRAPALLKGENGLRDRRKERADLEVRQVREADRGVHPPFRRRPGPALPEETRRKTEENRTMTKLRITSLGEEQAVIRVTVDTADTVVVRARVDHTILKPRGPRGVIAVHRVTQRGAVSARILPDGVEVPVKVREAINQEHMMDAAEKLLAPPDP